LTDFDRPIPVSDLAFEFHCCFDQVLMFFSGLEEYPTSSAKASARRQDITLADDSYLRANELIAEPYIEGDIVPFFDIDKSLFPG
jgi:hypothetical protein